MSRRNKKSYNSHPKNVPYHPIYDNNYNNYYNYNNYNNYNNHSNNYNVHSQQYYHDDNYNYNTKGRFQKRQINQRDCQNKFSNKTYQPRSYNINTQYSNNQNDYMISGQSNDSYFSRLKQDGYRGRNMGQYSNEYATNSEYFDPLNNEMPSSSGLGTYNTQEKHENIGNLPETDGKLEDLSERDKNINNLQENNIDNLLETDIARPSTRTVLKKSLLETATLQSDLKKQKTNLSYTDNFWKKSKENDEEPCYVFHPGRLQKKKKQVSTHTIGLMKVNKFEKKVNKMLSAPVEMSKGRSLLEKMGWKGGGLGKDGDGIVEPIAPKVTYATTTLGLGQLTVEEEEEPVFVNRVYFASLKYILEFVKNYLERELKFEASLSNHERKRIHQVAEALRLGTLNTIPNPYRSIVEEINYYNDYLLVTESTGERKKNKRYLTLYKEAHDHTFLISPEDFEDEEEIMDDEETNGPELVPKNINSMKKIVGKELNETDTPIEKDINNKAQNEQTNDVQNHINNSIDVKNNTEIIVLDSDEETNNKQNEASNEIKNDMKSKVIGCETEDANNKYNEISNKIENQVTNSTENKETDSQTEVANDMQNLVNSKTEQKLLLNEQNKTELSKNKIENSELKNITDTKIVQEEKQKDKPKDVNDLLNLIFNYFKDFAEDPLYTELRFLGPFNYKERCAIDMFFKVCKKELTVERSKEVLDLFDCNDYYLELKLDNNGRYVIHKIEKEVERAGS